MAATRPSRRTGEPLFAPLAVQLELWRRPDAWVERWITRSRTHRGRTYVVALRRDGVVGCSCPHWIYRRSDCRHIAEWRVTVASSRAGRT
jgi:RimJ/RimL family protein N-acetyltransferase